MSDRTYAVLGFALIAAIVAVLFVQPDATWPIYVFGGCYVALWLHGRYCRPRR